MPCIEHGWRVVRIDPLLVLIGHVHELECFQKELGLVLDDKLMLLILDLGRPVSLNSLPLMGCYDSVIVLSDLNQLWRLVEGIVLHISQLVVLHVELKPQVIVNIDLPVFVALFSPNVQVILCIDLHLHFGVLNLVHLLPYLFTESLYFWGWASLVQGLDALDECVELTGALDSLKFLSELRANSAILELLPVLHGLPQYFVPML